MNKRLFGQTGVELSVVGFGGMILKDETTIDAARYVNEAVERGINYFDVGPAYGNAEERMGSALKPYRDRVFLACKTGCRRAEEVRDELRRSLRRLETDRVDLYQFHSVNTLEDVETILGPGGAMEAVLDGREKGLLRFIGFSAHADDVALAMLARFPFDSVLFPVSIACWQDDGVGPRLAGAVRAKGIGLLALKALAKRPWAEGEKRSWSKCWYKPIDTIDEAKIALRFTLSKSTVSAVSPSHAELLWLACDAAENLEDDHSGRAVSIDGARSIFA